MISMVGRAKISSGIIAEDTQLESVVPARVAKPLQSEMHLSIVLCITGSSVLRELNFVPISENLSPSAPVNTL